MIRRAGIEEAESLTLLINEAFLVERFFIDGDRITLEEVRGRFDSGFFLTIESEAAVYVELRGKRAYFGLLSVKPAQQGSGIGKRLIAAAEDFARTHGCAFMDITVVNRRTELMPFYGKQGYQETGTMPFPDPGKCTSPAHLICMSKRL